MRTWKAIVVVLMVLQVVTLVGPPRSAASNAQEDVTLYARSQLIVNSDQPAIQKVVVRGNLSTATVSNTPRNFTISSSQAEFYTINLLLSYPSAYTTTIRVKDQTGTVTNELPSYYVSNGDLNLTVTTNFQASPDQGPGVPLGFSSFYDWVAQFGAAFPLWVKVLYLALGAQFAFVGYRWVRYEDDKRRLEGHLPPLDRGNKFYLWTDIAFKALLTGFAISLALMVGEILIVTIAEYVFLINLSLLSIVDFFSLFFVAVLATILYLAREGLDRFLDLKPVMED